MVEIALRAISPAVNDPHTAINCINRIGALLIDIGESYKETKFIADNNNRLRVIKKNENLSKLSVQKLLSNSPLWKRRYFYCL